MFGDLGRWAWVAGRGSRVVSPGLVWSVHLALLSRFRSTNMRTALREYTPSPGRHIAVPTLSVHTCIFVLLPHLATSAESLNHSSIWQADSDGRTQKTRTGFLLDADDDRDWSPVRPACASKNPSTEQGLLLAFCCSASDIFISVCIVSNRTPRRDRATLLHLY